MGLKSSEAKTILKQNQFSGHRWVEQICETDTGIYKVYLAHIP